MYVYIDDWISQIQFNSIQFNSTEFIANQRKYNYNTRYNIS